MLLSRARAGPFGGRTGGATAASSQSLVAEQIALCALVRGRRMAASEIQNDLKTCGLTPLNG